MSCNVAAVASSNKEEVNVTVVDVEEGEEAGTLSSKSKPRHVFNDVVGGSDRGNYDYDEEQVGDFYDSIEIPIFVVDTCGTIIQWNRTLTNLTGYTKNDVYRTKFYQYIVDDNNGEKQQCSKTIWEDSLSECIGGEGGRENEMMPTKKSSSSSSSSSSVKKCDLLLKKKCIYDGGGIDGDATTKYFNSRIQIARQQQRREGKESGGGGGGSRSSSLEAPAAVCFVEDISDNTNDRVLCRPKMNGTHNSNSQCRLSNNISNSDSKSSVSSPKNNIIVQSPKRITEDAPSKSKTNGVDSDNCSQSLSQFIQDAKLPIIGVDVKGNIDMWNMRSSELTGYDKDDIYNQSLTDSLSIPIPTRQPFADALQNSVLNGSFTSNFELELVSKDGETLYWLVTISPRRAIIRDSSSDSDVINGAILIAHDVTESAQHERAVAAMANELRQLLDTANAPIFGIDEEGLINEWNEKMVEITGYTADEAFDMCFMESFVTADQYESVKNVVNNALKGRGSTNYELELRTKNTHATRYLLVNATTRRDEENNITGMVCIAQDVTEASKHDRAIAAMASELRQLIDTANAPIFGIDCDGDINEWNDKTAEITGYTKEEAFDCNLVDNFIVPYLRESVQEVFDSALQGRGTSNFELEFCTKSNDIRHLLLNATTRRDAENNVVGVVGVAQDVTEAVQRDKAVAGMALELRQLIDTANAPIFGIDVDGNVNEWNYRTQEITGYSKEETFDEPLVEAFIAPSMQERVKRVLELALQGNETSNYELEFVSKSGEPRFMLVNATTRRDPDYNVVGVVGVAQDVTEDRKQAAELRNMQFMQATQEAKVETERNMTAYFAHELRNPLSAIDSALAAMPDDLPKTAKSLIAGMQLCSSFMSSIMNNLLDVRKMEEGKMTLKLVPMSLEALLIGVHKMLQPSVKPGVAFIKEIDVSAKGDWVLGDEPRFQQVLTNVITNAIKYTYSGSITIRLLWEGDSVKFECIDTGPGIPKNEQEKLFERFVQRGGAPGTGLGLAIAKHLVDLTGGSIRFESDPTVKAGTTCVVLMPLKLCDPPEALEETDSSLIEDPLRFLIIDDVKMNRMMLQRRIKKGIAPNCDIAEARTGEEALEICGHENFDVIIVDQYMEEAGGVMVGTDVVYAMRRMRIKSIIIGCSGNDLDEEFADAGADFVWKKPLPTNKEIVAQLRLTLAGRGGH